MERAIRTVVVDDENRIRRGIERLVVGYGAEFQIVGSYKSGLDLLETLEREPFDFDLLLTDIKMPGMDGLELIQTLRGDYSFEAVVISGFNDFPYVQTAIRSGAVDYLVKPMIREEFRQQLGRIKEKIWSNWERDGAIRQKENELVKMKQVQRFSDLLKNVEVDVSELHWTEEFRQRIFTFMYISKDERVKGVELEKWQATIETQLTTLPSIVALENWYWPGEGASYWMLIESEHEVNQMAGRLKDTLKRLTGSTHSVAVSLPFSELALLPTIKEQLQAYMKLRLFNGGNQLFIAGSIDLPTSAAKVEANKLHPLIEKLVESLELQQKHKSFELLDEFFKEVKKLTVLREVEQAIHSLAVQTVHVLLKNPRARDGVYLIQEALDIPKHAIQYQMFSSDVKEWLTKVWNSLELTNQTNSTDPISLAKQWMKDHLGENITIEKVAREIPMNPTYFCEYFKNQTGETVLDYVTKLRIEKAREYLMTTEMKIYDIAAQVGYSDTKHFSKLFKKYYGEVPSKFKEKLKI